MTELVEDSRRKGGRLRLGATALALPATAWMLLFFAVPLLVFLLYSFLTAKLYDVAGPLTLEAYRDALTTDVNRTLAWNSLVVGLSSATATLAIGLPIAYWLRFAAGRWQVLVLFLITATFFASYLVRIYAWRSILGENGLLNSGLERLGILDEPLGFLLYNRFSVTVALVHIFLPYVVLVLYAGFRPVSPPSSRPRRTSAPTRPHAGAGSCFRSSLRPRRHRSCSSSSSPPRTT